MADACLASAVIYLPTETGFTSGQLQDGSVPVMPIVAVVNVLDARFQSNNLTAWCQAVIALDRRLFPFLRDTWEWWSYRIHHCVRDLIEQKTRISDD